MNPYRAISIKVTYFLYFSLLQVLMTAKRFRRIAASDFSALTGLILDTISPILKYLGLYVCKWGEKEKELSQLLPGISK